MNSPRTQTIVFRTALLSACTLCAASTAHAEGTSSAIRPEPSSTHLIDQVVPVTVATQWKLRDEVLRLDAELGRHLPSAYERGGFTYTETAYDKPRRERLWWWGKTAGVVVVAGIAVWASAGTLVPLVGGWVGGMTGLSGAAAVSHGLALLGGGSLAAGGFGMAGGTVVVLTATDLALSAALDYSLSAARSDTRMRDLTEKLEALRRASDADASWANLIVSANQTARRHPSLYPVIAHAIGVTYLEIIGLDGLGRAQRSADADTGLGMGAIAPVDLDKQRILMTGALRLLASAEEYEPESSMVTHATASAYWWLMARGGYEAPSNVPQVFLVTRDERPTVSLDDLACYEAALDYFERGALYEPKNAQNWSDWMTALESDGSIYEGIAVAAAASSQLQHCHDHDKALILRKAAALQYQAESQRAEVADGVRDEGQLSPRVLAALQSYSEAWRIDPSDWMTLLSLANLHRQHEIGKTGRHARLVTRFETQRALAEMALEIARQISRQSKKPEADPTMVDAPIEFARMLEPVLSWSFDGISDSSSTDEVAKFAYENCMGWIRFLSDEGSSYLPFSREQLIRLRARLVRYNEECTFGWNEFPLERIEQAIAQMKGDANP